MKSSTPVIIAVDGYSSCGKSTFAKRIANKLNYVYIDTGAMYRAVALYALQHGLADTRQIQNETLVKALDDITIRFRFNPTTGTQETWLNGTNVEEAIRGLEVSAIVSKISQISEVRRKMVGLQRSIGEKDNVVMDGRDIGTVVFPQARLKIFMTADVAIRAQRRYKELKTKGIEASFDDICNNIRMRDHEDETRSESPLQKASDAHVLDNSHMSVEQQMEWFENTWNNIENSNDN
ncbi:MAG: (d)CMP kinase [Bacteroidales bacterium]|nr:(d)CMP kinase [Bacteroidales bacterium]